MDSVELQTLRNEMLDDCRVAVQAFQKAQRRFERKEEIAYEACAHQLSQMYNACEQMLLRVAKAFENAIEDEKRWHGALLNRLAIAIEGVRPALITEDLKLPLQELKAFRHVIVHAYELQLDPDKLRLLLKYASQIADRLPALAEEFIQKVARDQAIEL